MLFGKILSVLAGNARKKDPSYNIISHKELLVDFADNKANTCFSKDVACIFMWM